ncbi:Uncharacterized protein FKW44_018515 [Caligus rogercresseyi]|uniref:THAP-type domain-containing protein n=1 Tax=Caligus rogercresseyi TaxID=217165 RepID=A0A7T8GUJ3_CALRO|nr:Uncharacterized protein FKW44_018515 [Caligus rogercresseyi]
MPTKDLDNQRLWIARCRRSNRIGIKNTKICGRHITPDDFQRNLQAELLASLLGRSIRLKLFLHSEFLDPPSSSGPSPSDRSIKKP